MSKNKILKQATMVVDLRHNKNQKGTAIYLSVPEWAFDYVSICIKKITRRNNLKNRIIYVDVNYGKKTKNKRGFAILKEDIKKGYIEKVFFRKMSDLCSDRGSMNDFFSLCERYMVSMNEMQQ